MFHEERSGFFSMCVRVVTTDRPLYERGEHAYEFRQAQSCSLRGLGCRHHV